MIQPSKAKKIRLEKAPLPKPSNQMTIEELVAEINKELETRMETKNN